MQFRVPGEAELIGTHHLHHLRLGSVSTTAGTRDHLPEKVGTDFPAQAVGAGQGVMSLK